MPTSSLIRTKFRHSGLKRQSTFLAAAVLLTGWSAFAGLFQPTPETIAKIKADPQYNLLITRADNNLKAKPINPKGKYGTGKGRDISFWPRVVGVPLYKWMESLGFAYLVTGNEAYAKKGIELLIQTAKDFPVSTKKIQRGMPGARGHITYGMALGCYFFGSKMTPAQLDLMADVLAGYIDDYLKNFNDPAKGAYHTVNHTALNGAPAGLAALYFLDRPGFGKRLDQVTSTQIGWLDHAFDARGLYLEGYGYARYGMTPRLLILGELLREQGKTDIFKHPKLKQLPFALIEKLIPGTEIFDTRNDNNYTTAGLECLFLAVANQDSAAMWLWENSDKNSRNFPLDLLIAAKGTPTAALDFAQYPKGICFANRKFALWRTGWSDRDVMFSIESGPAPRNPSGVPAGHGQSDRGSIALYGFGEMWLADSGYGNDSANPASRCNSFAHNLVLVDGKGQAPKLVDGKMTEFSDNAQFGYSRSDLTQAYRKNLAKRPGSGARRMIRDTFFVRPADDLPAYAVVLDDFDCDGQPHEYIWNGIVPVNKIIETRPGSATLRVMPPLKNFITSPLNRPDGRAEWEFDVKEPGEYLIWSIVWEGGKSKLHSDSLWLSVNSEPKIQLDTPKDSQPMWSVLTRPKEAKALAPSPPVPVKIKLKAGKNRVVVSTREKEAQLFGLYFGRQDEAPFFSNSKGVALSPETAKISGGMTLGRRKTVDSASRMELFLFAATDKPVDFTSDTYLPPNPRPPLVMQRLQGRAKAVNPRFAAVLLPLLSEVPTPEVTAKYANDHVTVTVNWPHAMDIFTWANAANGIPMPVKYVRVLKQLQ